MNISDKYIGYAPNNISNIFREFSQTPQVNKSTALKKGTQTELKDILALGEMSENLEFIRSNYGGFNIMQGDINSKPSYIKYAFTDGKYALEMEGKIGDKKINLIRNNNWNYTGTYNNKHFELVSKMTKNKQFINSIQGTIDGKQINIKLKGAKIPEDSDTRDIITSILALNLNSPAVVNGKIANIVVMNSGGEDQLNAKSEKKERNIDRYIVPFVSAITGVLIAMIPQIITNKKH